MLNNLSLYLIRHGESNRNLETDLIGQAPEEELTPKGELQAKKLGQYFDTNLISFNKIYASPYKRALHTAEIVCQENGDQITEVVPALREYFSGDFLNKSRQEVITKDVIKQMEALGMGFKFPKGESLYEVELRASTWLISMLGKCEENDKVALFSHGMTIKCLLHYIMNFNQHMTWRIACHNTSVSHLELKNGYWHVNYINDTKHLT